MVINVLTVLCSVFILYNYFAMYVNAPMLFLASEHNFICAILHGCTLKFSIALGICFILIAVASKFIKEDTSKVEIITCLFSMLCCVFLVL